MQSLLKKQTILLADDNIKNLQLHMDILNNYAITYVKSADKVLATAVKNDFDLIMLQSNMPEITGFELCKMLKSDAATSHVPILILLETCSKESIQKVYDVGATDYVEVPFLDVELLKRVDSLMFVSKCQKDLRTLQRDLQFKVNEQVDIVREKDKVIYHQDKIIALRQMIDMITLGVQNPVDIIRYQNQSLQLKSMHSNILPKELESSTVQISQQIDTLNQYLIELKNYFNEEKKQEDINLKLLTDTLFLSFKDEFDEAHVKTFVSGSMNLEVAFVLEEIKYIFKHLILNSVEAFEKREIKRRAIDFVFDEDRDYVYITYKDSAGGVHSHNMGKLFDVDFTTKDKMLGSGLFLSKLFIEKNGGEVSVKNALDGLCFTIKIIKRLEDTLNPNRGISQEELEDIFINGIYI